MVLIDTLLSINSFCVFLIELVNLYSYLKDANYDSNYFSFGSIFSFTIFPKILKMFFGFLIGYKITKSVNSDIG